MVRVVLADLGKVFGKLGFFKFRFTFDRLRFFWSFVLNRHKGSLLFRRFPAWHLLKIIFGLLTRLWQTRNKAGGPVVDGQRYLRIAVLFVERV